MLESLRTNNKIVGIKQSLKALEGDKVKSVYIAKDADEKVVANIMQICKSNSIDIIYVDSMKQLGKACGIEVGAAVACITK